MWPGRASPRLRANYIAAVFQIFASARLCGTLARNAPAKAGSPGSSCRKPLFCLDTGLPPSRDLCESSNLTCSRTTPAQGGVQFGEALQSVTTASRLGPGLRRGGFESFAEVSRRREHWSSGGRRVFTGPEHAKRCVSGLSRAATAGLSGAAIAATLPHDPPAPPTRGPPLRSPLRRARAASHCRRPRWCRPIPRARRRSGRDNADRPPWGRCRTGPRRRTAASRPPRRSSTG
ncbi:hypothetical protein BW41_01085 [Sphingomonas sp. RIT328]|nr:hypothetical protein BW41_01085 [Sphingomonas sp. RIT328]